MEYYKVTKIHPWLYAIYDPGDVYIYLVLGDAAALVYDTGYGIAPIMPVVREITDLPVTCVLGHGHIDHANGAYQFDEAWIYEEDMELCLRHTSKKAKGIVLDRIKQEGRMLPEGFDEEAYMTSGAGSLKKMDIGQIFKLGGKSLEVVKMEGHTHGSVGLLVREERVLLTSDGANPHLWLFLEESTSIHTYIAMLKRNINLEFDTFFIGHGDKPFAKDYFKKFINVAKNANMAQAVPYNRLPERKGMLYTEGDVGIVFSEDKL
jgi:glyoxylase-like metal-dependent hydrolase (beta-lactamase superfamily II)